jgi:hypothetical protein
MGNFVKNNLIYISLIKMQQKMTSENENKMLGNNIEI